MDCDVEEKRKRTQLNYCPNNERVYSEIIHKKKQLIFEVTQTSDFVLPNQKYKYQIYCKNSDETIIENLIIRIISPEGIVINKADETNDVINLGCLKPGESKLLYLTSRCAIPNIYNVHFVAYGVETGLFYKTLEIDCNYTKNQKETTHIIAFYDFTPYEDNYKLEINDFSKDVTQLFKKQKIPYGLGNQPFPMINDYSDESQSFIDQLSVLKNSDEFPYQYLARELYTISKEEGTKKKCEYKLFTLQDADGNEIQKKDCARVIESYIGKNFEEILNQINEHSQYFRAKYLRTGNNQLLLDFAEVKPDGFIYRVGLLNSELYHHVGVLPEYTYMSDFLFRWAPQEPQMLNLYPEKKAMHWGAQDMVGKKWAGHGYQVWRYQDNLSTNKREATKIHTFLDKWTAKEAINKHKAFDKKEGDKLNRKYKIVETFDDVGVFFIEIPIELIPSNFFKLNVKEIETIVQKTKPYGVKSLIRYKIQKTFYHNMEMYVHPKPQYHVNFNLDVDNKIKWFIQSLRYQIVNKQLCSGDNLINVQSMELAPYGLSAYNGCGWESKAQFYSHRPLSKIVESDKNAFVHNNTIEHRTTSLKTNNNLMDVYSLKDILYYNRFNNLSFKITSYVESMKTAKKSTEAKNIEIMGSDYKLWTKALESPNHHITIPLSAQRFKRNDGSIGINYILKDDRKKKVDLLRISTYSKVFNKDGVEVGIVLKDNVNRLHGFSTEFNSYLQENYIKYVTSYNGNYKIQKDGYENVIGLAFKIIPITNNNLIIFYIEKLDENGQSSLNYFNHILCPNLKEVSLFIRNQTDDIININSWYNLLTYSFEGIDKITLQTPAYKECNLLETNNLPRNYNGEAWKNLYRIDKAENSYAYIQNTSNEILDIEDISMHFENLNIPENAIIKNINLKSIIESNVQKEVLCSYSIQNNIFNKESKYNSIKLSPKIIECYSRFNEDIEYYETKYNIAKDNQDTKSMKLYEDKIIENTLLDEEINYSLNFLNDYDKYISVKKSFWTQLSDFTNLSFNLNDIELIEFVIEGFNDGPEVNMVTQLMSESNGAKRNTTKINSGFFYEKIPLNKNNDFFLDNLKLRYKFEQLNNEIKIFDYYIKVKLKNKKEIEYIEQTESDVIEVLEKKYRNINIVNEDCKTSDFNNGLTVTLSFDSLYPGELYKVYSVELEVVYQNTDTKLLIHGGKYTTESLLDYKEETKTGKQINKESFTAVLGNETDDAYISGLFYTDAPTVLQEECTNDSIDKGIELREKVYQSFTANRDNITSIEIFPNGFVGNPDSLLKIGLYENHGFTPGKLIKEIYSVGWTKSNNELKYLNSIKYNINIDNLQVGETYWFKIEVVNPIENNYYLLKNNNKEIKGFKMLLDENDNYINPFSSLKFVIHSTEDTFSFSKIPTIQTKYLDPFVQIGLNRHCGEISKLRVKDRCCDIETDKCNGRTDNCTAR